MGFACYISFTCRCVIWSTNEYTKKVSGKGCKVTKMSQELEDYAGNYFARQGRSKKGPPLSSQMAKMSNGFLGIVFALHLCAKVDILGFDQVKPVKNKAAASSLHRLGQYNEARR